MYKQAKTKENIEYILNNLRKEDEEECRLTFGENWKDEYLKMISDTEFEVIMGVDDKPICMGGVWSTDIDNPDIGCAWLLSTDEIVKHKRILFKEIVKQFKEYDKKFYMTCNYIYEENQRPKRWLKKMGFQFAKSDRENFEFFYRINPKLTGLNL